MKSKQTPPVGQANQSNELINTLDEYKLSVGLNIGDHNGKSVTCTFLCVNLKPVLCSNTYTNILYTTYLMSIYTTYC